MAQVTSRDGTPITYAQSGTGSPLILVHGTGGTSQRWAPILPALQAHFRVYAVDRRGYGASGDNPNYALEREFEDIAAVVDAVGEPAHLLGHSFGALCALEAAVRTQNLRKLILYEPGIPLPGVRYYPEGVVDRMQALLDAGDRDGVMTTLYRDIGMFPSHELEQLRASPVWPARVASAPIALRETRAEERYTFEAQRFRNLHTPTLLLTGGDSPAFLKAATEMVAAALPNRRIAVLPGQQHLAMDTAPELFLQEVRTFLTEPS